jgi:hypothetical protein
MSATVGPPVRPRSGRVALSTCLAGALLGAGSASSCATRAPLAREWLAIGFRSPEQCLASFQVALAGEAPDLEYRCFSSGMRRREGLSQLAYREARERLLREQPAIRRLADARVRSREARGDGSVVLQLEARAYWTSVWLEVLLVREGYVEAFGGEQLLHDASLPARGDALWRIAELDGRARVAREFDWPADARGTPAELTELRSGLEWKIDSIRRIDAPRAAAPAG